MNKRGIEDFTLLMVVLILFVITGTVLGLSLSGEFDYNFQCLQKEAKNECNINNEDFCQVYSWDRGFSCQAKGIRSNCGYAEQYNFEQSILMRCRK